MMLNASDHVCSKKVGLTSFVAKPRVRMPACRYAESLPTTFVEIDEFVGLRGLKLIVDQIVDLDSDALKQLGRSLEAFSLCRCSRGYRAA